jgi:SSS family solute:Na+ symporter
MAVGTVVTLATMIFTNILANEPIYFGLLSSLVTYVVVSLMSKPTPAEVLNTWQDRLSGREIAISDDLMNATESIKVEQKH